MQMYEVVLLIILGTIKTIEIPEWYIVRLESIVENLNDYFSSMIRELWIVKLWEFQVIVTVLDGIDAV